MLIKVTIFMNNIQNEYKKARDDYPLFARLAQQHSVDELVVVFD